MEAGVDSSSFSPARFRLTAARPDDVPALQQSLR
jgi:hypothetical protein